MAKIPRQTFLPFGSTGPTDDFEAFGSTAVGSPDYTKDVPTIQAPAAWGTGWRAALLTGLAPALQDQNAVHYVYGQMLGYLFQQGIPEWDSGTTYYVGSIVTSPGSAVLYQSLQNSNTNNSLTNTSWWLPMNTAPSVSMRYNTSAGPVIGTGYANVTFGTEEYDSYSAFNGTTFTSPVGGVYSIAWNLESAPVSLTAAQAFFSQIVKNGATIIAQNVQNSTPGTSINYWINGACLIYLAASDTITLQAFCSVSTHLGSSGNNNWLAIQRISN